MAKSEGKIFTFDDVAKHNTYESAWIVVDDKVYDITNFAHSHPGGKVIYYYRGEDATDVVYSFHPDLEKTKKFMKNLYIGELSEADKKARPAVVTEFRQLREQLRKENKYALIWYFYVLHLLSIVAMEILAYFTYYYTRSIWLTAAILCVSQIQAGWLQHDFGHCSVFRTAFANQWAHYFIIGGLKGASSWWWKSKHNRHHSKTNIIHRDPDMHVEPVFSFSPVLVDKMPKRYFPFIPYQKAYWWVLGPPTVTTVLFWQQIIIFLAKYGFWADMLMSGAFFLRFDLTYRSIAVSPWEVVYLMAAMRFLETHWFTWVTSMNHLPMPIVEDSPQDWVSLQAKGTQNIDGGFVNNWITGHLNYQIEHHFFPLMPRHRYPEVAPRVEALCKKYNIEYRKRGLLQSFGDILQKLEDVAEHFALSRKKLQ